MPVDRYLQSLPLDCALVKVWYLIFYNCCADDDIQLALGFQISIYIKFFSLDHNCPIKDLAVAKSDMARDTGRLLSVYWLIWDVAKMSVTPTASRVATKPALRAHKLSKQCLLQGMQNVTLRFNKRSSCTPFHCKFCAGCVDCESITILTKPAIPWCQACTRHRPETTSQECRLVNSHQRWHHTSWHICRLHSPGSQWGHLNLRLWGRGARASSSMLAKHSKSGCLHYACSYVARKLHFAHKIEIPLVLAQCTRGLDRAQNPTS